MGAKQQTANLLKIFLIKKPSILVPPSPFSSSSLRHLTTVKTITIKDEWDRKQTFRIKVDKRIKTLLQCQDDKLKQEDHLVNLFSSTSPPRLLQFFFDKGKYGDEKGEISNLILQVLYKHSQLDYAQQFLSEILDDKDFTYYAVYTKYIVFDGWAKAIREGQGQLQVEKEYMMEVVNKFCDGYPPIESITSLIFQLCKCGHVDTAWDLVQLVQERSQRNVSSSVINILLYGLGSENKFDKMRLLLPQMICTNIFTFRIFIYHLCKSQRVDDALQVLNDMESSRYCQKPDIIVYNIIIKGLCVVGRQEEALVLVEKMISEHGYAPNIVTYNALISGFCKAGETDRSKKLFEQMKKEGVVPSMFTYVVIIQAYCKVGQVDDALEVFGLMVSTSRCPPKKELYNIIIDSLCKEKKIEDALSLMDEMTVKGVLPDVVTYNAMFRGLKDMNRLEKAFKLIDDMKEHACNPNEATLEILTEWHSAVGDATRLNSIIQEFEIAVSQP